MSKIENLSNEEYQKLIKEYNNKKKLQEKYKKLMEELKIKIPKNRNNETNTNNENSIVNEESENKKMVESITRYLNTKRNNHQYTYTKNFIKIIRKIFENKDYLYYNCKKNFSTIITKDTEFYKSYGFHQIKTFNNNIFRKSPFMWFAFEKEIAERYGDIIYTFKLIKDVKLINICSHEFIKDFTKKINIIFSDYEFIRDLLFFPFGNISPLLQKYYMLNYLGRNLQYTSENVLDKINTENLNLYEFLLLKGKRESRFMTDAILMFILIKLYPEYDGYMAEDRDFRFHPEICLFNPYNKIIKLERNSNVQSAGNRENNLKISQSKINTQITLLENNNPLQYNIEDNIGLILKLQQNIGSLFNNLIKNLLPTYNEILLLNRDE